MNCKILTLLIGFIVVLLTAASSQSYSEWIVHLDSYEEQKKRNDSYVIEKITQHQPVYKVTLDKPVNLSTFYTLTDLDANTIVYPNYKLENRVRIPDDFHYDEQQWSMEVIQAPQVWDRTTGGNLATGEEIVIAILDDGFDVGHDDLKQSIWINEEEIPDNGRDDDNNGYIDDDDGLNIATPLGEEAHPFLSHGTKIAGIIAAKGNNGIGITGVNWNVKILLVSGVSTIGEILKANEYVYNLKKKYIDSDGEFGANILVTNMSSGIEGRFPSDIPSWCPQYDMLGSVGIITVVSAPNTLFNVEQEGDLPSLCTSPYLISVTNTDRLDQKVLESGIGPVSIDLGAPGEEVFTTTLSDDYTMISGTSASAPHVSGGIGLLYSIDCLEFAELVKDNPSAAATCMKDAIINGVDKKSSLSLTATGGRMNLFNSMQLLNNHCTGNALEELDIKYITVENSSEKTRLAINYSTDQFSEHNISVHNFLGQLIYTNNFIPDSFNELVLEVDLETSNGLYVITLSSGKAVSSETLFVP